MVVESAVEYYYRNGNRYQTEDTHFKSFIEHLSQHPIAPNDRKSLLSAAASYGMFTLAVCRSPGGNAFGSLNDDPHDMKNHIDNGGMTFPCKCGEHSSDHWANNYEADFHEYTQFLNTSGLRYSNDLHDSCSATEAGARSSTCEQNKNFTFPWARQSKNPVYLYTWCAYFGDRPGAARTATGNFAGSLHIC